MKSTIEPKRFSWEMPSPRDSYLHLSIRRSTLNAFLASILLHLLVLFVVPQQRVGSGESSAQNSKSLVVNLRPRSPLQGAQSSSATIPENRSPQAPVESRPKTPATPIVALNKSRGKDLAKTVNPVMPPLPSAVAPAPPTDMQSYVIAARARRGAADGLLDRENVDAASYEREPTEDEIRLAKVKRNLASGTNGVFQILSMESRTAAFSFRGWTTDASNSRREYIQVEIGANSDIEIAIVRKMIELIRRYYKGNFNWESQRLDRIVVLSARMEDNDGLEGFLLQEFFGARSRTTRVR